MPDTPEPTTPTTSPAEVYAQLRAHDPEMTRLLDALDLGEPLPEWIQEFLLTGSVTWVRVLTTPDVDLRWRVRRSRRNGKTADAELITTEMVTAGYHVHVASHQRTVCYQPMLCEGCEPPS